MNAHGARLTGLTRELWGQWQQTKQLWSDSKSKEFEHKFMEELLVSVDRSVLAIEQLEKLLAKIKKDCE